MKVLVYALLIITLALPQMAAAQEPPDDPQNPDWLQPPVGSSQPGDELQSFYPYMQSNASAAGTYATLIDRDLTYTVRTCPSKTAVFCWEGIPNRALGFLDYGDTVQIDLDHCVYDTDGVDPITGERVAVYKWCHTPAYDHNATDSTLIGWIAVCHAPQSGLTGCWYEFKRVQGG